MIDAEPAVEAVGLVRRFGTTVALDGADLVLRRGEIHAVLGENGAGKTTMMRILAGLDRPDEGSVRRHGALVEHFDPREARDAGVALVQQHFTLVPTLTAGENLELARPDGVRRRPRRRSRERLDELIDRFGLPVRGDVAAGRLSVGEQQRLELLRALDADAELLVLDEPTAVLTDVEADQLFSVCRRLAADGRAVAVITHRLGEVVEHCDRVTVLRNGSNVITDGEVAGTDRSALTRAMVGADDHSIGARETREAVDGSVIPAGAEAASDPRNRPDVAPGSAASVRLRVEGVRLGRLLGIDLEVHAGQIVGVAGVDGNGQAEFEAVLSGRVAPEAGVMTVDGVPLPPGDPAARHRLGVAYIPSDRYRHGLVGPLDLADNLELGRVPRRRAPRARRRAGSLDRLAAWDVRTSGPSARASSLSGGNAQKLVLARELSDSPGVVVACHPTRGLDPGAAATVADRLVEFARAGAAVVWIGAELDELFGVSDRLVVFAGGEIADRCDPPFDRERVGSAMASALPVRVSAEVGES